MKRRSLSHVRSIVARNYSSNTRRKLWRLDRRNSPARMCGGSTIRTVSRLTLLA